MDWKVLERLFEEDMEDLVLGLNGIHFYNRDEIGDGQIGYRCNDDYVKIEDWIGDNYFVIGYETLLLDPILIDVLDEKLPVYSLVCDDFSMCKKIANSILDYRKILRMVMDSDLSDKEVVEQLIDKIKEENDGIVIDYWKDLLYSTYEDLSFL